MVSGGTMLIIAAAVVMSPLAALIIFSIVRDIRISRQMKEDLKAAFEATLVQYGIQSYEILLDKTSHGYSTRASTVFQIILDSEGRYFLYIYVSDSPPVVKQLTKERAMLAMQKKDWNTGASPKALI
ncbi:hypothetical protein SAMN04515675_6120 [Pseudomonas costantinii]|uniref:Uncharacterized protein n=2 Tax=Pseudomonas costantinii TaxID=168469 RepID=A0A1S2UI58_9PSED|nr:hypothetical protein BFL40_27545 [Pseudomonas costantinii]SEE53959.1 hypothetical protein SAMN04515675_6120 [Pseudomonas costantinii]